MAVAMALVELKRRPGGMWGTGAQRLLQSQFIPPNRNPASPKHDWYANLSSWRAPSDTPPALPYFVRCPHMHNIPGYYLWQKEDDIHQENRRRYLDPGGGSSSLSLLGNHHLFKSKSLTASISEAILTMN
uniref:Uncharacterized protein n=1 Tax=Chelonoidis abingdonii TaxID=106734 RepID=A0A8C0JED1_CHEAB